MAAWDPNSSSWDWDAEGVIVTSHVNGIDLRKPAASDWPSDTELCSIKHDGSFTHTSRGSCSFGKQMATASQGVHVDVTRHGGLLLNRVVTPAMANMHTPLVFDGATGHGNMVPMAQGRVPIVTTCIGGGAFIGCIDNGNGSLESVVRNGLHEKHGNGELHPLPSKAISQHLSFAQDEQQLNFTQDKQQLSFAQDERHIVKSNGKDYLVAATQLSNKNAEGLCNGNRKVAADEQHSSTAMCSGGSGDSLTGLQLGKRTYAVDATTPAVAKPIPKLNSTSKKARAGAAAMQIPRCQVEGCKQDLTSAKDYHRRHKVCDTHSKARKVVVASLEQRFCQQCSRFHVLTEFDEAKRSCRRRLAGHNKRRRKPQQDPLELQARLRSTLGDWPFLHQPRYSRLPFWQDAGDFRSSGLWPSKMMQYEDQPNYDYTLQSLGTDIYMKGLSPSVTHDKFPLSLLQSPKTMMPMDTCDPRVHQYLPGVVGNGLTLASSSLGAGAFTGFETTPVMEVTRVSDSGRALSLLSLHSQCSQAPDMASLDLSGLANTTIDHDQHVRDDAVASQQFLLQGRHPYCQDFSTTLSMSSNVHLPSTTDVQGGAHVMASDKEFYECSFMDNLNLNRQNSYDESHSMQVVNMQGHETTDQGKQTQDLMQISSFQVPNASSQRPSIVFQLESSQLGDDSHFSHGTSFLKF